MAREDMIRQDMQLVGTYNAIFEPTIKQLAKTERELSRAEKEWKKQGGQRICTMVNKTGAEYTATSPVLDGGRGSSRDGAGAPKSVGAYTDRA